MATGDRCPTALTSRCVALRSSSARSLTRYSSRQWCWSPTTGAGRRSPPCRPDVVAGLVLTPEEAFDNYPPGLPGVFAALACRLPGGLSLAARSLRIPGFQRLPMTFGRMAKRPIPREMLHSWTEGLLTNPGVRSDVRRCTSQPLPKAACSTSPSNSARSTSQHGRLEHGRPDDAEEDHGQALAELIPELTLVELDDCSVLMPLDQPRRLAKEIRALISRI